MSVQIKDRIDALVAKHGSLRAVGLVLGVDHSHLHRIRSGEKVPSQVMARKLGLRKNISITYEYIRVRA